MINDQNYKIEDKDISLLDKYSLNFKNFKKNYKNVDFLPRHGKNH